MQEYELILEGFICFSNQTYLVSGIMTTYNVNWYDVLFVTIWIISFDKENSRIVKRKQE